MKLTIILLTAFILNASAKGVSQTITFTGNNVSLKQVFIAVEQQTGYVFFCDETLLQRSRLLSVQATNEALTDFLDKVLGSQHLVYRIKDRAVIITPAIPAMDLRSAAGELLVLPIRGRVLDADGVPLAGVTVALKGGKVLGATNAEGMFTVNVSEGDVLIISSVGFEPTDYKITPAIVTASAQQSTLGTGVSFTITLKRKESQLDEVVVNKGYYSEKKRLSTGNVSKVDAVDIEKNPVSNPLAALQGRVPGLQVTQASGVPGGGFTVRIRGQNSIASGNNPLYIIDGVPFTSSSLTSAVLGGAVQILGDASPLNSINPLDIQSIEILKDADATAIYGSRGANGVILITTKKGKAGKTSVALDLKAGGGKVASTMSLLNTQQYIAMRKEAFKNDGATPDEFNAPDLMVWDTTKYTDWQKKITGGTAHTTNAQISVSGGSANTQFLVSGGYYKETTVFPGDFAFQKVSINTNLNHTSENQKFKISLSANFATDKNHLFRNDITAYALITPPNLPGYMDDNGNLLWPAGMYSNPYAELKNKYNVTTDNLVGNTQLSYELFPGMEIKTSMGYTQMRRDEINTNPLSAVNPAYLPYSKATTNIRNASIKTWLIEPQAQYHKNIGRGKFTALVGAALQESIQTGNGLTASDFSIDDLLENIQAAATITAETPTYTQYRYNAVFGRLNYNFSERYIVNLTGRRDGSSRFGPGKQFADFGAAGVAWIFSQENFFSNHLSWLSFGKLRGSYGTTGNDQIGDYQYLDTYSTTAYSYPGTSTGLAPTRLFNADFAWERNRKIEAAIELGFLKNRIQFAVSYYRNRSNNQLVGYPLPPSTGFPSIQFNLPALVQNTGVELTLNTTNIKTRNFSWTTDLNISIPRNKLVKYPDIESSAYVYTYIVGRSLFIKRKYHSIGVDPATGVYKSEDANGDGVLSYPDDLQAKKEVTQKYYGGLQNSFRYKGWQLDIFAQFVNQVGTNYLSAFGLPPGFMSNQPTIVLDRWQKPGDIASVQQFSQGYGAPFFAYLFDNAIYGDMRYSDASFIRLKNISLSYQFDAKWIQKLHIQSARLYIQGQNLLTITNFLGADPESQLPANLPPLKMITAGIQVSF